MELAGYLEISVDGANPVALVDNYMSYVLSQQDQGSRWQMADECPECVCPSATCGVTAIDCAPWADPHDPAALEFYGAYGRLRLAAPVARVAQSATGTRSIAPLKRITFVGVLLARSQRGAAKGLRWFESELARLDGSCGQVSAGIHLWCRDPNCDDTGFVALDQGPTETVAWCDRCLGACSCGEPLGATPAAQAVLDSGYRDVLDVQYVPGSLVEIEDPTTPLPACHGIRITFQFLVNSAKLFGPVVSTCTMAAPTEDDLAAGCEPCCSPLLWNVDDEATGCGCPTDCSCVTTTTTLSEAVGYLADGAAQCRYSTPLCSQTYTCLTAPIPGGDGAVPTISITAGASDLVDVSVTIWEARRGLEDPAVLEGLVQYEQIAPVVDAALIHRIPANSTLVLDARDQTSELFCQGQAPSSYPVERCGGRRYRHPTLECGRRYWVAFEVHCEQTGDWSVTTEVRGV